MTKRPITLTYIVFYILFLPDTWQVAIGVLAACVMAPRLMPPGYGIGAQLVLYLMLAGIGYAASKPIGKRIAEFLKKIILGKNHQNF